MFRHYKLVDREPVPISSVEEIMKVYADEDSTRVSFDKIGTIEVSTIFTVIDLSVDGDKPILFETMIFGGKYNNYTRRCSTYNEALSMHEEALNLVMHSSDSNKGNRLKVDGNNLK